MLLSRMKKHFPNILTSLGLIGGCIGIGMVYTGDIIFASVMIIIAAAFDFLDGLTARLLNAQSKFGKELDSLADVVSFGVLPGMILFRLLEIPFSEAEDWKVYLPFISFLIPLFSALRLAKFNTDTRQSECFLGVPTPANALFIGSIPLIIALQNETLPVFTAVFSNPGFIISLIFLLSFLLVAPLPLFAFKFTDFTWKSNNVKYILIFISTVLIIVFQFVAAPMIFFLYILLSIIFNPQKK